MKEKPAYDLITDATHGPFVSGTWTTGCAAVASGVLTGIGLMHPPDLVRRAVETALWLEAERLTRSGL